MGSRRIGLLVVVVMELEWGVRVEVVSSGASRCRGDETGAEGTAEADEGEDEARLNRRR